MIERLTYLISTCKGYEAPAARLFDSMAAIDVRDGGVRVVHGGYPERVVWMQTVVHVPHVSYDYTALIDLVEYLDDYAGMSHVFLLHDTMELSPDSDHLIRAADPTLDCVAVWGGECNLGLYRVDYLQQRRAEILALKDCTKLQAVQAEGFLWRTCPEARRGSYAGGIHVGPAQAVYGGAARQAVTYEGVGITKYKANWGQVWPPNVVTP